MNRSTIKRWVSDPDFRDMVNDDETIEAEETDASITNLIPKAYKLLERALDGDAVPAARARIALDVLVKAAGLAKDTDPGESSLAKRLAELDASGNVGESD